MLIALLIVTCPCALALATPLTVTVAIGRAASEGILIRGADALQSLARPGRLLLDKTGTLTEGRLGLEHGDGNPSIRPLVLALEQHSNHPLAQGFREAWPELPVPEATGVRQTLGSGLAGTVAGQFVMAGTPAWVLARADDPDAYASRIVEPLTPVLVAVSGRVAAAAGFGDPIRPEA